MEDGRKIRLYNPDPDGRISDRQAQRLWRLFVEEMIPMIEESIESEKDEIVSKNYVGALQEFCQQQKINPPVYNVRRVGGEDHTATFQASVAVFGKTYLGDISRSKNEAKKTSARNAMLKDQ